MLLIEAARAAGEIALRHWRRNPQVWEKPGGAGPVTSADLAVDAMLRETLPAARPDYGWLSEETPDTGALHAARLAAERVFIADPIDGTRAFIAGEETFSHALAVAEAGEVVAAAVFLPVRGLLYAATRGGTATLNGAPLVPATRTGLDGASFLAGKAAMAPEHWQGPPPDLRRAFRASLAWRLCLVAEGRFDGLLTLRDSWEWDIAAGDLIARTAGARVTDRSGQAIRYNAPRPLAAGVVAAPPALHAAVVERLARG